MNWINRGFHLVESCKSCLKVFWFDLDRKGRAHGYEKKGKAMKAKKAKSRDSKTKSSNITPTTPDPNDNVLDNLADVGGRRMQQERRDHHSVSSVRGYPAAT